jgi:hypothetical protein
LTFKNGTISTYARGLTFDQAEDVDHDGRVDLLTFAPYQVVLHEGGCMPGDRNMTGPTLLLHSLADGGFSRDDDAARDFARQQCAGRPRHLVLAEDAGLELDSHQSLIRVACQQIWGASDADQQKQIRDECAVSAALGEQASEAGIADCNAPHVTEICSDAGAPWSGITRPLRLDR